MSTEKKILSAAAVIVIAFLGLTAGYAISNHNNKTATLKASPSLFVSPSGSDGNSCSQSSPCASMNRAYQVAQPGQTVSVASGTYSSQVIQNRSDITSSGCSQSNPGQCITFTGTGVTINGVLEIHGSGIWVNGGTSYGGPYGIRVTGYADTETFVAGQYPTNIVVSGVHSTSFGIFNSNNVTFTDMEVGPATVSSGCGILQGPGIENKIGFGNGITTGVPNNITLDGLIIHDQNGDSGRIASDCHFGGLFFVTANGAIIKNSTFYNNVVYNVQVQNFGGAPPATNVTFTNDAFGCATNWIYQGMGCDGQSSIQFDYTPNQWFITNNAFNETLPGWSCIVTCSTLSGLTATCNTGAPNNVAPPPLPVPVGPPVTTTTQPTTTTTTQPTTTSTTTTTTQPTSTTTTTQPTTTTTPGNVPQPGSKWVTKANPITVISVHNGIVTYRNAKGQIGHWTVSAFLSKYVSIS